MENLTAMAEIHIGAPPAAVWEALIDHDKLRQFMFGADVESDWEVGSPIVWKGEWKGKPFEDHGKVLKKEEGHLLQYDHFSPLSGRPDVPENHHTVTIELSGEGDETELTLTQDHNATEDARRDAEQNWSMMLQGLRKVVERERRD